MSDRIDVGTQCIFRSREKWLAHLNGAQCVVVSYKAKPFHPGMNYSVTFEKTGRTMDVKPSEIMPGSPP